MLQLEAQAEFHFVIFFILKLQPEFLKGFYSQVFTTALEWQRICIGCSEFKSLTKGAASLADVFTNHFCNNNSNNNNNNKIMKLKYSILSHSFLVNFP